MEYDFYIRKFCGKALPGSHDHTPAGPFGSSAFFLLNESTPQHREWFNELIETYVKWTSSSLMET